MSYRYRTGTGTVVVPVGLVASTNNPSIDGENLCGYRYWYWYCSSSIVAMKGLGAIALVLYL